MDTSHVWRGGWIGCLRLLGILPLCLILAFAIYSPFALVSPALHERFVVTAFGCSLYLGVFLLSMYLFSDPLRREGERRWLAFWRIFAWVRLWHGMVFASVLAGALIGGGLYSLSGLVFGEGIGLQRLLLGLKDGAFYVFIWAPGASLIACVMVAFHGRKT